MKVWLRATRLGLLGVWWVAASAARAAFGRRRRIRARGRLLTAWWDLVFALAGIAVCVLSASPLLQAALAEEQAPASGGGGSAGLRAVSPLGGQRPAATAASAGPVRIAGDAPIGVPAAAGRALRPSATSARSEPLTVTVVLKRTNQAAFDRYLTEVYNRRSPIYHDYLSQTQLANRFGPSLSEYDQVKAWLGSQGLKLTQGSANRLSLTVRGTRTEAERAFHTPIVTFKSGDRLVYSNTKAPAVPRRFAADVAAIMGLSNLAEPKAAPVDAKQYEHFSKCVDAGGGGGALQLFGELGSTGAVIAPPQIAARLAAFAPWTELLLLVGIGSLLLLLTLQLLCLANTLVTTPHKPGSSAPTAQSREARPAQASDPAQKIGLLEFDTYKPSDVTDWLNLLGVAPSVAGQVSEVNVNGGVTSPGAGESEVLVDIDTVLGLSPASGVVVYDAPASTSFAQMFQAMIADGDTVISNSWSQCEDQTPIAEAQAIDSVLASAAASGITVVNGSGDGGTTCLDGSPNTVGVPADSPHATAVGGTSPQLGPGATLTGQSYWDDRSGDPPGGAGGYGVSRYFARPAYQNGFAASSMRSVPDLAVNAEPAAGIELCQADAGGCPDGLLWGGTSMAAPEMAAEIADLNQAVGHDVGNLNSALYPLAATSAFESGASMGSDFAHVGLGAPNFSAIYQHLTGITTGAVSASGSLASALGQPQADGTQQGLVRVDLEDANGLPVGGKAVTITPNPGSHALISPASATTDSTQGAAVFTVTDTAPETVTFTVTDTTDGVTLTTQPTMTFVTPTATGASIVASPQTVVNDGTSQATITVYLENSLGQPAAGKTVSLTDNEANATISPASGQAITDSGGLATFTATDTANQAVSFTATDVTDNNLPVPGSATVNFAPAGPANCVQTLPTGSGGFAVSPFASGLGANQQAIVTNGGGLAFTTPACDGAETPVFDASGNVYVPDDVDGHIYRFGPGGGTAGVQTALPDTSFAPNGQLDAIAFGTNGEMWATTNSTSGTNPTQPELLELDPQTGATERVVATRGDGLGVCPQYNVAVDPLSGDVFTGDDCGGSLASDAITRVHDPDSASPTVSTYTTEAGAVVGMAFAPDGTMYVVQCAGSPTCTQVDAITGTNGPATPAITRVTNLPKFTVGLAVASTDAQGHATALEAADQTGNVYRVDLTQNPAVVTTIASGGGGSSGTAENQPVGVGRDGCLYVARADTVYKVAGAGCSQASAGPEITLTENGSPTPPTASSIGLTATLHNFANAAGTPVHFTITGPNLQAELADADAAGQATVSYAGVFQGVDTITASAIVGGQLVTSAPVQVHWSAGRDTTFLDLNASQPGGIVGHAATIGAELVDVTQSPPVPVSGATVTLALGSSACAATTNASGVASCAITPSTTGLLPVTASYGGDAVDAAVVSTNEFESFTATAPRLTKVKVTPSKFRAAKGGRGLPTADASATAVSEGKHKRPPPPTGTTISYVDSLPAKTTLTVEKAVAGVRKGKRCEAPPRHRPKHKRLRHCVRYVVLARVVHVDRAGTFPTKLPGVRKGKRCVAPPAHRRRHAPKPKRCTRSVQTPTTIAFDGRVRGRALAAGRYRLQAVATIDGLHGRTITIGFTIER